MKNRALMFTFIDSSNIGDNLIVDTLSDMVCEQGYNLELMSYQFKTLQEVTALKNSDSPSKESKVIQFYKKYLRNLLLFDIFHKFLNEFRTKRNFKKSEVSKEISKNHLIIFGGGNAVFAPTRFTDTLYKMNMIIDESLKQKKMIVALSVGIGPFKTQNQEKKAIEMLKKCDYVTVRDKKSFSYLQNEIENAYLSVDPVFFIDKKIKKNKTTQVIGYCLIDYRLNKVKNKEYNKYVKNSVILIKKLLQDIDADIILYSSEIRDYPTVLEVYSHFKNDNRVQMVTITKPEELLELYQIVDIVLGTRMHSMITAISQDIPIVGLSWQDKVTELFRIMDDSNSVFEINKIEQEITNISKIILKKLKDKNCEIKKNKEILKDIEKKCFINKDILLKLKAE